MTTYETILDWAVTNVDGALRKAIRKDIRATYANPHNSKGRELWETLYLQRGKTENLPSLLNALPIGDRVRADELHSCWLCGTPHGDGYTCTPATPTGNRSDFIGHNCAERLTRYGLRAGVLTDADKRTSVKTANVRIEQLDDLILKEGKRLPLFSDRERYDDASDTLIGSQMNWLKRRYDALPEETKQAYDRVSNQFAEKAEKKDLEQLFDYVGKHREFPASTYKHVAQDLGLMEARGLARQGTGVELLNSGNLTQEKVYDLLKDCDVRGFRISENERLLEKYADSTTLAQVLNDLAAVADHDKPLWRKDLVRQQFTWNKVLSRDDYRLVAGTFNRWRFGYTSEVAGSDARKLRERAIRLESATNFAGRLDGLVAVQRKLSYAIDHTSLPEFAQLGAIEQEILKLPEERRAKVFYDVCQHINAEQKEPALLLQSTCIPIEVAGKYGPLDTSLTNAVRRIEKTMTKDKKVIAFRRKELPRIKDHLAYDIIRRDDLLKVARVYNNIMRTR
jgi:hypothetical protein